MYTQFNRLLQFGNELGMATGFLMYFVKYINCMMSFRTGFRACKALSIFTDLQKEPSGEMLVASSFAALTIFRSVHAYVFCAARIEVYDIIVHIYRLIPVRNMLRHKQCMYVHQGVFLLYILSRLLVYTWVRAS